jgi:hypothetical protein
MRRPGNDWGKRGLERMAAGMQRVKWLLFLLISGCMQYAGYHPYLVTNDGCRCEHYQVHDAGESIRYTVSGVYEVDGGISTHITIKIQNMSADTLDFSLAYVRISSRNIPYRYNEKSLPVTVPPAAPGEVRTITLQGQAMQTGDEDPWLRIAGEELVLRLKGVRIGERELSEQVFLLVPVNPRLGT